MRVIECNVVSKLQRNRCITFGDLRRVEFMNELAVTFLYIYIDIIYI
jgi:hypothetical protein